MIITKKQDENELTVVLEGQLDAVNAPAVDEELRGSVDEITELVLDLEKLEYISSAGLRVLLSMQKIMTKKGSMKLINVPESIREIFEATGFSEVLTIE